jgi:L-arabinose transport system substrate-binding protein
MKRRFGIRTLCTTALAVTAFSLSSSLLAADTVKIGFLVKQAEEPWFQTEWAFAEKAGQGHGFEVIKIAVPDGEKTLSAIDSLAANGAKGFVICPPDVSLGPAIVAKAKANDLKVMAVDDRFVDAKGKFMEDVPYLGMAAFEVGQKQGAAMARSEESQLGLERNLRDHQHLQRTGHRQEAHRRFGGCP